MSFLALAAELAARMEATGLEAETMAGRLLPQPVKAPAWLGEIGLLGDPERSRDGQGASFLLWLGPRRESEGQLADRSKTSLPEPGPSLRQLVLSHASR